MSLDQCRLKSKNQPSEIGHQTGPKLPVELATDHGGGLLKGVERHRAIFRRGGSWNRSLTLEIELLAGKPRNAKEFYVVGNENRPDAERGSGNNGIRQFELVLPPETDSQVFHFFTEVNYLNFREEILYLALRRCIQRRYRRAALFQKRRKSSTHRQEGLAPPYHPGDKEWRWDRELFSRPLLPDARLVLERLFRQRDHSHPAR